MDSFNQIGETLPTERKRRGIGELIASLGAFERLLVGVLFCVAAASGTTLLYNANSSLLDTVPRSGGKHVEGGVGTPRFINPLLALSDIDNDLTMVVYAGLMARSEDGTLVPELADHYEVSEDGTTYTFTLKPDLTFHDGEPLTAADVVYTVEQAANAGLRSPVFANWEGVKAEQKDDRTVVFTLPEPYAPFIENTTLGILPKHIWAGLTTEEFSFSQFNVLPVGAGPYHVTTITRDSSGIPSRYELTAFSEYALGEPHITDLAFNLYKNTDELVAAFKRGDVDAIHGIGPEYVSTIMDPSNAGNVRVLRAPLLRVFGVFFNHNKQPVLLHDEVREALDAATPKQAIVDDILGGYGSVLYGPIPGESTGTTTSVSAEDGIARARTILEDAGWKRNEENGVYERTVKDSTERLALTLSTVNTPELELVANRIAESWRKAGAEVEVKVFDPTDLTQSIIRPRRYEALLFGEVVGHELDLYAFWHSSQRNDPGLNIAQFADIEADALLEKMRTERDGVKREELYRAFENKVNEKHSAIFVYAPDFIYLVRDKVEHITLPPISDPSDRFSLIHAWYIETDHVWPFVKDVLKN